MDSTAQFYADLLGTSLPPSRGSSPTALNTQGKLRLSPKKTAKEHLVEQLIRPVSPLNAWAEPVQLSSSTRKKSKKHVLPALDVNVVRRQRLILSVKGEPQWAEEEIVEYHEASRSPKRLSSLAGSLNPMIIPARCAKNDIIPLMPCHAQENRSYSLEVERWEEPIRDRDKQWSRDELAFILKQIPIKAKMSRTRRNGMVYKDKWRNTSKMLDQCRLPDHLKLLPHQLLLRRGVMISRTIAIVSVVGIGISGRVYGAGLQDSRYIHVEAYAVDRRERYELTLTMEDMEDAFSTRRKYLQPGRKKELCVKLLDLLYFEYPEGNTNDPKSNMLQTDGKYTSSIIEGQSGGYIESEMSNLQNEEERPEVEENIEETSMTAPKDLVLKISRNIIINDAKRRRLDYEEKMRLKEEELRRQLEALMAMPKRNRHRILCRTKRLRGFRFFVGVYLFPNQKRTFIIRAYHPPTSTTFSLTIGIVQAGEFTNRQDSPAQWTEQDRYTVASLLLRKLDLIYSDGNMALSILDRSGYLQPCLELATIRTAEIEFNDQMKRQTSNTKRHLTAMFDLQSRQMESDKETFVNSTMGSIEKLQKEAEKLSKEEHELELKIEELDGNKPVDNTLGESTNSVLSEGAIKRKESNVVKQQLRQEIKERKKELKGHKSIIKGRRKNCSSQITKLQKLIEKEGVSFQKKQRNLQQSLWKETEAAEFALLNARMIRPLELSLKRSVKYENFVPPKREVGKGRPVAKGSGRIQGKLGGFVLFWNEREQHFRLEVYLTLLCETFAYEMSMEEFVMLTKEEEMYYCRIPMLFTRCKSESLMDMKETDETEKAEIQEKISELTTTLDNSKSTSTRKKLTAELNRNRRRHGRFSEKVAWKELVTKGLLPRIRIRKKSCMTNGDCGGASSGKHIESSSVINVRAKDESREEAIDSASLKAVGSFTRLGSIATFELNLDRRIFRSMFSVPWSDDVEESLCIQVFVTGADVLVFQLYNPVNSFQSQVIHPTSKEIIQEFFSSTYLERYVQIITLVSYIYLETPDKESEEVVLEVTDRSRFRIKFLE